MRCIGVPLVGSSGASPPKSGIANAFIRFYHISPPRNLGFPQYFKQVYASDEKKLRILNMGLVTLVETLREIASNRNLIILEFYSE